MLSLPCKKAPKVFNPVWWALCLSLYCFSSASYSKPESDVLIVASIAPIHSILVNLLPDSIAPKLLLDAHQSPHSSTLKPSQRAALSKADVFFYMDVEFESFIERYIEQTTKSGSGQKQISLYNPLKTKLVSKNSHIWLSPKQVSLMAEYMHKELMRTLPSHKEELLLKHEAFQEELSYLDVAVSRQIESKTLKPYIVYHNAYEAFEKQYKINHEAVITKTHDHHGGSLSVKRIAEINKIITKQDVQCVFLEPQFSNNNKLRRLLNKEGKIQMYTLDPLGSNLELGKGFITQLLAQVAAAFRQCI